MRHITKTQFTILGSAFAALTLILAACGGGGTSSGAGAGGSSVASVSGTVNGGSGTALKVYPGLGPAYLLTALGDIVIPAAYAVGIPNINVEVNCGPDAMYGGTTDMNGKFKILVPNVGSGNCTTSFNGALGPAVSLSPGMETEIEVTLAGTTVNLVGMEQRANTELEIEVDDGTSDVASASDDAVSDDDSQSIDQASIDDDQSSESTGGGTGTG